MNPLDDLSLQEKLPKETTLAGTPCTVATNLRLLTVNQKTSIFKFDVNIKNFFSSSDGTEKAVEVSRSVKKGPEHIADKNFCKKVYLLAVERCPELNQGTHFFYDQQASLYSLMKIKKDINLTLRGPDVSKKSDFVRCELKITPVAESFQATTSGIKDTVNACPAKADKTLLEALNMIISGPAMKNENVFTQGNCVHYLYTAPAGAIQPITTQGGKLPSVGTSKSVKTLEGTGGKHSLFLSTELKTTLFHPEGPLLDVVRRYNGFRQDQKHNSPLGAVLGKVLAGISVFLNYGKYKAAEEERTIIFIRGLGPSARDHKFEHNGKTTTVFDYFRTVHKIKLQYPDLFTVAARNKRGEQYFPVELLHMCPDQIVRTEQMSGNEQADLIKNSAAFPDRRKRITETVAQEVGLLHGDDFIEVGAPQVVKGFVLPKPDILFSQKAKVNWAIESKKKVPTDFSAAGQYIRPAELTSWVIVFQQGEVLPNIIDPLLTTMRNAGMKVVQPEQVFISGKNLRTVFENAKTKKRQLLFFVTKSAYNYHDEIKSLEQEYDILTQEIRFETALKVPQQTNTRMNIVNKTNMKLGGLNYTVGGVAFNNPSRLFVGFETSQNGGGGGSDFPLSIGFSANMMRDPAQFSGGYVYVERSGDKYGSIITSVMSKIFATYEANGRRPVTEIFVFFSGVTEGQYGLIRNAYLKAIKQACINKSESFKPHITIIAASKTHNERLFKSDNNKIFNLEPGTIIDTTIVSPVLNEWYHASSVARQGTTKTTKFTLIFTTIRRPEDMRLSTLEKIANELCYDHQIVFHPISLPVPLYLAGSYSQRGARLLAYRRPVYTNGTINLEETNRQLGYEGKRLFGTRFNA